MANARTVVTKGPRGLEDRGSPARTQQPTKLEVPSDIVARKDYERALQSAKSGLIVQLTAPADRYNDLTGVRVKARPLVLSFATHSGFIKLDLRNAEDRRRWLYVVGSEAAEKEFKKIGVPVDRDPLDGTDPIAPHPRFGLGKSFWLVSEMQKEIAARSRENLLKQLAADPEMAAFVVNSPDELARHLAAMKEKMANPGAKKSGAAKAAEAPVEEPVVAGDI